MVRERCRINKFVRKKRALLDTELEDKNTKKNAQK